MNRGLIASLFLTFLLGAAASTRAQSSIPAPDAADIVKAHTRARTWVDGFTVPQLKEEEARIEIADARAVCIILRRSGEVVGIGIDAGESDLRVARATRRALGEAYGDPIIRAAMEVLPKEVGGRLTLELEVAAGLTPLVGNTFGAIAEQIRPGLDGVAIRRGEQWQFWFPSQMRVNNTTRNLLFSIRGLISDLQLPVNLPLAELQQRYGVSLYSFTTTDLVQRTPRDSPFVAVRGDTFIPASNVTPASLGRLADAIAAHVLRSAWPDPGETGLQRQPLGMLGDYRPTADLYQPRIAPPMEQAMVSHALSLYAAAPGVNAETAADARTLARRILVDLTVITESEARPLSDLGACATIVLAIHALPVGPLSEELSTLHQQAAALVWTSFKDESGYIVPEPPPDQPRRLIPPAVRAMLASAMAELLRRDGRGRDPNHVRLAIDAAWESVPGHQQISLLPWIGWAEAEYASVTGTADPSALVRLGAIQQMLDAAQVDADWATGQPDILGGYVLSNLVSGGANSQGLRPIAWVARSLADRRFLSPESAETQKIRVLRFARFLTQLSVRPENVWAYPNPPRVLGGLRNAMWDSDQPVSAQALGLATLAFLLEFLHNAP